MFDPLCLLHQRLFDFFHLLIRLVHLCEKMLWPVQSDTVILELLQAFPDILQGYLVKHDLPLHVVVVLALLELNLLVGN